MNSIEKPKIQFAISIWNPLETPWKFAMGENIFRRIQENLTFIIEYLIY